MNAAPCCSHPTFIGSVPEKCSRISPDLHCIIDAAPCGSHPTSTGSVLEKCYRISPDLYYTISVEGELAVPRSGRRSFRPTANFSKPRDTSHGLSSNIKPLGTVYHKRCPMPVLIYVYRPCFQNSCRISPPSVLIIVIERKWMMPRNGGRNPRPTGPKIPPAIGYRNTYGLASIFPCLFWSRTLRITD